MLEELNLNDGLENGISKEELVGLIKVGRVSCICIFDGQTEEGSSVVHIIMYMILLSVYFYLWTNAPGKLKS